MMRALLIAGALAGILGVADVPLVAQPPVDHRSTLVDVPGSEPREHTIDVQRMSLDVQFVPEKGRVQGKVSHVFTVLRPKVDSIVFDAVKLNVTQALLAGKPVRTRSTDSTLTVYCEPALVWDQVDSVQFVYDATPRRGIYFIGWNDPTGRMRKQIWTQGQATDNRHWIPMYDEMNDKYITETSILFDSSYQVLSNGTRIGTDDAGNGMRRWHYRMTHRHAPYLLMLAIGAYDITSRTSQGGVPLYLYSYPDHKDEIEPTYRYSAEAVDFLERELGVPYPWESYSQIPVADFIFGAMENTTATIFGDFLTSDARSFLDRNYIGTNVHELTHQWFGDYITARAAKHVWLQESFATFYPHLYTERIQGADAFQWSRRGMQRSALAAGEKDRLPVVHPSSGNARVYPKGAVIIDMMRSTFGADAVRRVITHYLKHHAYSSVETNDLYLAFQDTLGLTPTWFFRQWLYQGGEPHYKVGYAANAGFTDVWVDQIHTVDDLTGYFRMPIVFEAHYEGGGRDTVRAWVEGPHTSVRIPNRDNKPLAFVLFDPGSQVLKTVTFDKPFDERMRQLKGAPLMIDRYDALESMKKDTTRTNDRIAVLEHVMASETFQAMRAEAVRQAAGIRLARARTIVEMGLKDRALEVRQAALAGLDVIDESVRPAVEGLLADSSYVMVATALSRLCNAYPSQRADYLRRTAHEHGKHERVRIAWLENAYIGGDASVVPELVDLGSASWEFRTRQLAFDAWKRCNLLDATSVRHLLEAATSPNERLAGAATTLLETYRGQIRYAQLIRQGISTMEPEVSGWRLERLRALQN